MKNSLLKLSAPFLICFFSFLAILLVYYFPVIQNKVLMQNDMVQIIGSLKEANTYQEKTGEEILWTNSTFAGMPVWRGHNTNLLNHVHYFMTKIIPVPIYIGMLCFVGFYILLYAFGIQPWLCFAGGIAFSFSSFNIISLEAGHLNKVLAMALMAPVIGGIVLTFRGKLWLGAAITTIFLSLQVFYNHIQISYYLLIMIVLLTAAELYSAIRQKKLPDFLKASAILAVSAIIAVGPNISRLWTTSEYAKSTPRGGSELSTKKSDGNGLERDYAFQWSNGITETMTLFIPSFYGGSSNEDVGQNSNIYKSLIQNGVSKKEAKDYSKGMPLYWGDQPSTGGPIYFGAIVCFLFVLGLLLVNGPVKWWILTASILSIVLSWGKNFEIVSDFFFYYVPLYNKFRSVTMILCIAQLTFPLLGFIVLEKILHQELDKEKVLKKLKLAFYITSGIALFFVVFGSSLFEFESVNDRAYSTQFPDWLLQALKEDRVSNMRTDAIKSFIFVFLGAALIWAFLKNKISPLHVSLGISFLVLVDLWTVDKRYLSNDDFKTKKNFESTYFVPSVANETILKDPDPNFRVFNYTTGLTSDAVTSYFHKSIGGYSAIKLRRYQDIIDSCLSRGNRGVINMLNTKYFIGQDKSTGQQFAQPNPEAAGNAWFVNSYKLVKNADEEINSLRNIVPKDTAYLDEKFADQLKGLSVQKDTAAAIRFISYHPHKLVYESQSAYPGVAVFSEIYYQPGWNAYLDGKPSQHFRTDYILRGMVLPAGKHTIEFRFEPAHYFIGEKISLAGSVLMVFFIIACIAMAVRNHFKNESSTAKHI